MAANKETLVDHMTAKLLTRSEGHIQAEHDLQEIIAELATELLAIKRQLASLLAVAGTQGLAIHALDEKVESHAKLARLTRPDVT